MKKNILIITIIYLIPFVLKAQVGIGNTNPDTNSVLDLHNSYGLGLLLPKVDSLYNVSNSQGIIYAIDSNLFLRNSNSYIALTAWKFKFNYNITNDVYYNKEGNIGIGLQNISIAPQSKVHIKTVDSVDLVNNGSLIIGKSNAKNIAFNDVEIQTRDIASSSDLIINEDGGDVVLGSQEFNSNAKISGNLQELHHPTNEYYDVVPSGMIIMWYGDTLDIPDGWALCNGKIYDKANGNGTLLSPDLRGKFVVSSGNNGSTNYSPYSQGGQDSVTLSKSELPYHTHNVRDPGHNHQYTYVETRTQNDAGYFKCKICPNPNQNEVHWSSDYNTTSASVVTIYEDSYGEGKPHENRPEFYTLVYIMKL